VLGGVHRTATPIAALMQRGSLRSKKVKAHLAWLHLKIKYSRNTVLHQASAALVKTHDVIALERLTVPLGARARF
jgi:hypothetical protein